MLKSSVTRKKSKKDLTRKVIILTPLQKLPKECGRFGQIDCCQRLQKLDQSPINRPIWSHCLKISSVIQPVVRKGPEEILRYEYQQPSIQHLYQQTTQKQPDF